MSAAGVILPSIGGIPCIAGCQGQHARDDTRHQESCKISMNCRHAFEPLICVLQNTASTLLAGFDGLQTDLQLRRESAAVMRATLASLNDRHESEAVGVLESTQRCRQYKTALQTAQAHRALRASLLTEKKELIANLQQELGQVRASPRPFWDACCACELVAATRRCECTRREGC